MFTLLSFFAHALRNQVTISVPCTNKSITLSKMNKLVALSLALVALVAFATAAPVASRRAIFFEEQRAGKVEYMNWPPVPCKADGDCVGINASYCMNDKTKTAPFFCHQPLITLTSGLARPVRSFASRTARTYLPPSDRPLCGL